MIYGTQNYDEDYLNYNNIWCVVDFLMTGNTSYINHILADYVNASTEAEIKTRKAKLSNMWLPHYYNAEVINLNSKVFNYIEVGKIDKKHESITNFSNNGIALSTYIKKALDSIINYGGVASVLLKINEKYIIKLIEGKHILSVCVSELGTIEYIKWVNHEFVYDADNRSVSKQEAFYEYVVEDNKVVLYVTKNEETVIIDSNFTEIPVVLTQLRINDSIVGRGTPYFASLATNTMRLLLNSMSLDYLLDTVLTPRLIHKGATPIKKISNNNWRGVNIGPQDSLTYLEHSGTSLNAARDQLLRYKEDINSMITALSQNSKQRTAYEISVLKETDVTVKEYIIDRFIVFLENLFLLASFIHPTLKNNKVIYKTPEYLNVEQQQTGTQKNGINSSDNEGKV